MTTLKASPGRGSRTLLAIAVLALSACSGAPVTQHLSTTLVAVPPEVQSPMETQVTPTAARGDAISTPTERPFTTPVIPPTSTPVPLPAAIRPEHAAALSETVDLGLTQVRIESLLRGAAAEEVLPMDDLGAAPEGWDWVYVSFAFASTCADIPQIMAYGMPVITIEETACAPTVSFSIADRTGRAFGYATSLDENRQVLFYDSSFVRIDFKTQSSIGFAQRVPSDADLWLFTLARVFFDSGAFGPSTRMDWDVMRNVIFEAPDVNSAIALEAPVPANDIGLSSEAPAQLGDTIITPDWRIRLVSITEGDDAVAAFRALGLPQRKPYDVSYLMELELTAQGVWWDWVSLPNFQLTGENPDLPLGFDYWTPSGEYASRYADDLAYYPGTQLTVYIGRTLKVGNLPLWLWWQHTTGDGTGSYLDRYINAVSPTRR